MISHEKYILTVLAEECSEVAKAASKSVRFGFDSYHPKYPEEGTNREILVNELNDIMAMVWELNEKYQLGFSQNLNAMHNKREKVNKYYNDWFENNTPPDPPKKNKMEVPEFKSNVDFISDKNVA